LNYFTKAMYEQMQIRGYWVYPDSEQELEADQAWYAEQGRDYAEEAKKMYEYIQPLMLKHLPPDVHPQVLHGSLMTSKWPNPAEAAWISEWKAAWEAEWKRRCNEYNDRYEQIKQDLPVGAQRLRENVRFHDAQIKVFNPLDDGSLEMMLKEIVKEHETRLLYRNVNLLCAESPELIQGSLCLYEEIDWTRPNFVDFRLLMDAPGTGLHELSMSATDVTLETTIQ
jgi:hypothetical protein